LLVLKISSDINLKKTKTKAFDGNVLGIKKFIFGRKTIHFIINKIRQRRFRIRSLSKGTEYLYSIVLSTNIFSLLTPL